MCMLSKVSNDDACDLDHNLDQWYKKDAHRSYVST